MLIFNVDNMTCGHCVRAITNAITDVDAKAKVVADIAAKKVEVESSLTAAQLLSLLDEEGYKAQLQG